MNQLKEKWGKVEGKGGGGWERGGDEKGRGEGERVGVIHKMHPVQM